MDAVSVAVVSSRVEAEIVAGLLRSYGLKAGVTADDAGAQEPQLQQQDRKSTRLNSSHANISYAVFCLKKKTEWHAPPPRRPAIRTPVPSPPHGSLGPPPPSPTPPSQRTALSSEPPFDSVPSCRPLRDR